MYRATVILYAILLASVVIEHLVFVVILRWPEPPDYLGPLEGLAAAIVCGVCGNSWYLAHARRVIAKAKSLGLPDDARLRLLASQGGTSIAMGLGFLVMFFVMAYGLVLATQ